MNLKMCNIQFLAGLDFQDLFSEKKQNANSLYSYEFKRWSKIRIYTDFFSNFTFLEMQRAYTGS